MDTKWRYLIMDYGYTLHGTNDFSVALAAIEKEFEVIDIVNGYTMQSGYDIREYVESSE
jgi:hypothetical protein